MTIPQFLYPSSRKFPFDEVCEQIVRELELRNFDVPGMRVEFDVYGSGEQKLRCVRAVESDGYLVDGRRVGDFRIAWNDTAAVNSIALRCKKLDVYEDESGPRFKVYVGSDWEAEGKSFMHGYGINSKLDGKPRTYLLYKGECTCGENRGIWSGRHTHSKRRSPLLVADNDLGREYDPEHEPREYGTAEIMLELYADLRDIVLAEILRHPLPTERLDVFPEPAVVPWPSSIGPMFCFADDREARRIHDGQADRNALEAPDRYALGVNWRLASLDIPNDGTVPKIAYDGFIWCGLGDAAKLHAADALASDKDKPTLVVPGRSRHSERFVLRVTPKNANDIYIADHGAYEKRRAELAAMSPDRRYFDNAEIHDFTRARARSIVPIHEYAGGFSQPVVLINRELDFDEVEIVVAEKDRY
jgi:hypothetical protein